MAYLLNPKYALRSWWLVPYAYYTAHHPYAGKLTKEEFEFLAQCDGEQELPESALAKALVERGMITPCEKGTARLNPWQKPMSCNNRYVPHIMISLTGRCNLNCLHCFNAADHAALQSEFSMETIDRLLDEAQACGVHAVVLTGGEPMIHPHFKEIVGGIKRRNMYILELVTNGLFLNQEMLDYFKSLQLYPEIKLSFDGLGYHDWMRGVKNVEKKTLDVIRLCAENGFRTTVHVNINKKNREAMEPTLRLLDQMGVHEARLLCTTPVPRWEQNAAGQSMDFREYYDACIEIAREYLKDPHRMEVTFWQFLTVKPRQKAYEISAVKCIDESCYRASVPRCPRNRGRFGIAATGEVYPCLQMTGWMESHEISFGNIKNTSLRSFMQSGKMMDLVCTTVGDLARKNTKCGECRFFPYCNGGCPAFGILYGQCDPREGLYGADLAKCFFYENGYYNKITAAMPQSYRNLSENMFLKEHC